MQNDQHASDVGRAYGSEHDTCHMYQEHFSHIPDLKTFSITDNWLSTINVQMAMSVHKQHSTSQLCKSRDKHKNSHMREIHKTECCRRPPHSFPTPTNSNDCKDFSQLITYHKEQFTSGFFENVLVILHLCLSFYLLMRHTFQNIE